MAIQKRGNGTYGVAVYDPALGRKRWVGTARTEREARRMMAEATQAADRGRVPMKRQPRRRDPAADEARAAFRAADGGMETRRPAMTDPTDWKQHHANEAEKAVVHPIVEDAADEFADNMGFKREGLPGHGLMKVASYAAQVARAQALGFDPELLLMSAEESDASALRLARLAAQAGKPVWLIVADGGGRGVSEGDAALRRERNEARAALERITARYIAGASAGELADLAFEALGGGDD